VGVSWAKSFDLKSVRPLCRICITANDDCIMQMYRYSYSYRLTVMQRLRKKVELNCAKVWKLCEDGQRAKETGLEGVKERALWPVRSFFCVLFPVFWSKWQKITSGKKEFIFLFFVWGILLLAAVFFCC